MSCLRWRSIDRRRAVGAAVLAVLALDVPAPSAERGQGGDDVLAREIARLSALAAESRPGDELWSQVKAPSEAALADARQALDAGRRFAALDRMAAARTNLAAAVYVREHPAATKDLPSFEAEWTQTGTILRADLTAPGAALASVRPAAMRAIGEAALSQVRVYYEAGLEYGRNTTPDSGLFYVGAAKAQQEMVAFARGGASGSGSVPAVRAIGAEIEALETELLTAYRPPLSIERHRDFIAASAAIKEARELDRKALRYGALYRYLQASLRVAAITSASATSAAGPVADRLQAHVARLAEPRVDHTLGRLFLELGQMALAAPQPNVERAGTIAGVVLPRYFAALEPARPAPPAPAPRVTITLVRWPFT